MIFARHEHLYEQIVKNMIVSDRLPKTGALKKALDGAQVILCTLSMISYPKLQDTGFVQAVPVIHVIIDEASQIEVGQYVPLIKTFGHTLRKLCFIGDDKQCESLLSRLGSELNIQQYHHMAKTTLATSNPSLNSLT